MLIEWRNGFICPPYTKRKKLIPVNLFEQYLVQVPFNKKSYRGNKILFIIIHFVCINIEHYSAILTPHVGLSFNMMFTNSFYRLGSEALYGSKEETVISIEKFDLYHESSRVFIRLCIAFLAILALYTFVENCVNQ